MTAWPSTSSARAWPPPQPRWTLGYEVDFTALPSETTWSSGAVSIDGLPWTSANAGNAATFGVTAGTGIEIGPNGGTELSASSQNAPYLEAKLRDLIGPFVRQDRLFVQVQVADAGLSQDGQAFGLQVGSGVATADSRVAMYELVYASGLVERTSRYAYAGGEHSRDTSLAASPAFLALDYRIFTAESRRAATSVVPSGASWPAPNEMTVGHHAFNISPIDLDTSPDDFSPDTDVLRLWAERSGTAGAFTATFQRLRILVQRWGS